MLDLLTASSELLVCGTRFLALVETRPASIMLLGRHSLGYTHVSTLML